MQHAGATHAQTRRAPGLARRVVGADGRMTFTAHAMTRNANAPSAGGSLGHSHALGRLVFAGRRRAVEVGGLYVGRDEGARRGVTDGFGAGAAVQGGQAARRTLKTELWATARAPLLGADPLAVTASWTGQRLRYSADGLDTLATSANRYALDFAQAARLGAHRLDARATLALAGDPSGGADEGDGAAETRLSLVVADSLAVGAASLVLVPGLHAVAGRVWPSADVRIAVGALRAGVTRGARAPSLLARRGVAGGGGLPVLADLDDGLETTTRVDAAVGGALRALRADLSAWASRVDDAQRLVALGDTAFATRRLESAVTAVGSALTLGLRAAAERGVYARATVAAARTLGAGGPLARREADALPAARLDVRVGARARDVGDGVLDLDLGVQAAGWTAFHSRLLEPTTGALALPDPSSVFGRELPARGTVGLDLTATFVNRATVFLRYDHALGGRLYDGATVTQGEPLADTAFRFGVFWALLD